MKVLIDAQTFMRQRTGGISRLFTDLVREFDRDPNLGVDVTLPFGISNSAYAARELSSRNIGETPLWLPRGVLYAPQWLRGARYPGECDIVHHTYYSRRFLASRTSGARVVTVYDMIPELFAGSDGFTATHLQKREFVEQCDLVICISESTRRDMVEIYGPIGALVSVVPLAVSDGFSAGLPPIEQLPSDYVLYVGKRNGYKDFALLPAAIEQLRHEGLDVPVVVVGAPFTTTEMRDLEQRGLRDLFMRVSLGDDELRRAYSNCALLVQTSRYEGFGLTPLEAMASGAPVVVARASSMPEVGGDVAQYFEAGDVASLAETLQRTLGDSALRKSLTRRGVERAAEFSQRAMAESTARAYREVLEHL